MRRKDKEISDVSEIEAIISQTNVCRLSMVDGNKPYTVPLCFGYQDNTLYFHGFLKGRKIDILQENPNVCFEFDIVIESIQSENACDWSMKYKSVVGFGKAVILENTDEKHKALGVITTQYSGKQLEFPEKRLNAMAIIKVEIESMTGKQSGF